jgi:hypothetical protein
MLRPFLLSLVLLGLGADQPAPDISTWRWYVSVILDAQRASAATVGALPAASFGQRYERYSVLGLPEVPAEAGRR